MLRSHFDDIRQDDRNTLEPRPEILTLAVCGLAILLPNGPNGAGLDVESEAQVRFY